MTSQTKPTGARGAAYLRVSHGDTEANEFRRNQDPTAQRTMIEQWTARHGLTVSRWYQDVEGRNPRDMAHKRQQFQRLMADVQAGLWDWVVVDSQDRIDPADNAEFGHFIYLFRQADCELWSVDASQGKGGLLTSTDIGAVFSTTVGSVTSAAELKERGKRQVSRKREHAAKGEWQGGYCPYGYDLVCLNGETRKEVWRVVIEKMVPTKGIWHRLIVYPDGRRERADGKDVFPRKQDWEKLELAPSVIAERIKVVQEIFELFASGAWTVRGLCQRLNQRHIDPVTGEGWYHTRLLPLLKNPVYHIGQTVWGKQSHGKNAQYIGGEYVIPPRRKGRPLTGRKNKVEDWVIPPAGTAIITKELFDEVQARINGRPEVKRGLRDERLWLAGLVVCERCGQKMSGWSQGGLSYYCTTYSKYGKGNAPGCRLHRVRQEVIEDRLEQYLHDIAEDVRALLATEGRPSLIGELLSRLNRQGDEFEGVVEQMKAYLAGMGTGELLEALGIDLDEPRDVWGISRLYRQVFDAERAEVEAELTEALEILRVELQAMKRLKDHQTEAIQLQQNDIDKAEGRVKELKQRLVPLDDKLDAAHLMLTVLDAAVAEAQEAIAGDDLRQKALSLRKVVAQIRVSFRHFEHKCRDRRSKTAAQPRSTASRIEFVPVQGQAASYEVERPLTVATSPALN